MWTPTSALLTGLRLCAVYRRNRSLCSFPGPRGLSLKTPDPSLRKDLLLHTPSSRPRPRRPSRNHKERGGTDLGTPAPRHPPVPSTLLSWRGTEPHHRRGVRRHPLRRVEDHDWPGRGRGEGILSLDDWKSERAVARTTALATGPTDVLLHGRHPEPRGVPVRDHSPRPTRDLGSIHLRDVSTDV